MITQKKMKLSRALLGSATGLGIISGLCAMEQNPDKTRFFLNEKREIERFLDSGAALAEKPQELIGKDLLEVPPYQFLGTPERKRLIATFNDAKQDQQKKEFECEFLKIVFKTKLIPMKDAENKISYLISFVKVLPADVRPPCRVMTLSDDELPNSIDRGLEQLSGSSSEESKDNKKGELYCSVVSSDNEEVVYFDN